MEWGEIRINNLRHGEGGISTLNITQFNIYMCVDPTIVELKCLKHINLNNLKERERDNDNITK